MRAIQRFFLSCFYCTIAYLFNGDNVFGAETDNSGNVQYSYECCTTDDNCSSGFCSEGWAISKYFSGYTGTGCFKFDESCTIYPFPADKTPTEYTCSFTVNDAGTGKCSCTCTDENNCDTNIVTSGADYYEYYSESPLQCPPGTYSATGSGSESVEIGGTNYSNQGLKYENEYIGVCRKCPDLLPAGQKDYIIWGNYGPTSCYVKGSVDFAIEDDVGWYEFPQPSAWSTSLTGYKAVGCNAGNNTVNYYNGTEWD